VTGNYGDRVTAVRTVEMTNPDEWDLVINTPPAPPSKFSAALSFCDAVEDLVSKGRNKDRHYHRWEPLDKDINTKKYCGCGSVKAWRSSKWVVTKAKK
jgi:hypothetical protein